MQIKLNLTWNQWMVIATKLRIFFIFGLSFKHLFFKSDNTGELNVLNCRFSTSTVSYENMSIIRFCYDFADSIYGQTYRRMIRITILARIH